MGEHVSRTFWLGASQSFNCSRWLQKGKGGIYTVPVRMENIPNPPDHPKAGKKLTPAIKSELEGESSPAPHVCGDGGGSPDPQGLAEQ